MIFKDGITMKYEYKQSLPSLVQADNQIEGHDHVIYRVQRSESRDLPRIP